jgi:hypothetical protein
VLLHAEAILVGLLAAISAVLSVVIAPCPSAATELTRRAVVISAVHVVATWLRRLAVAISLARVAVTSSVLGAAILAVHAAVTWVVRAAAIEEAREEANDLEAASANDGIHHGHLEWTSMSQQ